MNRAAERSIPWRWIAVFLGGLPVSVWWLERLIELPRSGWFSGATTFAIGTDLKTFYAAAHLAVHGNGSIIYEAVDFQPAMVADIGTYGPFGNPPPFVVLFAPLGWLSFEAAWLVWSAISVVGLVVIVRVLGVKRTLAGVTACLVFPPVYFALTFGQPSVLWLGIMVATYGLLRSRHPIGAGLVAGLLIMKPTLALGLMVWWLVDWRRYWKTALAALGSASGALSVSYLIFPEIWPSYGSSVVEFLSLRSDPVTQWAQFSVWTFWRLLLPDSGSVAAIGGVVSVVAIITLAVIALRRVTDLRVSFSIAILTTVLAAPHLNAYDWTLLIVPGVLLWQVAEMRQPRLMMAATVVAIASAWSVILTNRLIDTQGFSVQIAPLVLLAALWVNRDLLFEEAHR